MHLPVMIHHSSVGLFREVCTAGLPKYHLVDKKIHINTQKVTKAHCFSMFHINTWYTAFSTVLFMCNCINLHIPKVLFSGN